MCYIDSLIRLSIRLEFCSLVGFLLLTCLTLFELDFRLYSIYDNPFNVIICCLGDIFMIFLRDG